VARPEDVNWRDPRIKPYLYNLWDNPTGPFAFVDAKARAAMKQCLHHRNPSTGDIFPSVERLAFELPFRERAIRYGWGRLCTGPSRQRDGQIVDGWGLMWREKRWRSYGGQTSNAYGFTCKCLQLANLVLPHDPESCSWCRNGGAPPKAKDTPGPRRGRPRRPVAASLPLPHVPMQPPATTPAPVTEAAPADPDFETFAEVFAAERFAKYGDHDAGTVRDEKRGAIASNVLDVTAEACAWAQSRGLEIDRGTVREDLCRRIARLWLDMHGTNGFLDERRHPIGLIAGDLQRVGPEALAAWKRAQPKRKGALSLTVLEQPVSPPDEEAEAWPELDGSEPTDGELLAARAELAGGASAEDDATGAAWPPNRARAARAEVQGRVALALTGDAAFDRAAEQTRACAPVMFDQWFGGVQFDGLTDGVLSLRAQNEFVRDWVRQNYLPTLVGKLCEQTGAHVEVSWTIAPLSLPLVRHQPASAAIEDVPRIVETSEDVPREDELREGEPASTVAVLEDDDELAPVRAKMAEIHARGGVEAPRPVLPSHTAAIEARDEAAPAKQEPFARGVYGTVNAPMAEFLREQSDRSSEPAPRRGRPVRTRIALRTRPMGAAAPEAEEEAAAPPSEASATHPRRRHARSRLGLPYEQAGPAPPPDEPPDEIAEGPPWEGDDERGDGGAGEQ
jgi:hypothetical protein